MRARVRGSTEAEIKEVIEGGIPIPGRKERLGNALVFPFRGVWNGRYCEEKRVEVFYRMEDGSVHTVTVYVFYGKWVIENEDRLPG